jgi:hypothetical protein
MVLHGAFSIDMSNPWDYDPERERLWAAQRRQCLIRAAVANPAKWRPIILRWKERPMAGIDGLLADIREAWMRKHDERR